MSKRERNWRPSLMSMSDIEYDLRIGETKFREWMVQGLMPQPWISDNGVSRWRTSELDAAIDEFPDRAALTAEVKAQTARMKTQTARSKASAVDPWSTTRAA
jgi:hypothetical protein